MRAARERPRVATPPPPMTHIHGVEYGILMWFSILFIGLFLPYRIFVGHDATRAIYTELKKPFAAPPWWLFGPVWFILYTLEAISVTLIRLEGEWSTNRQVVTLVVFIVLQFVLAAWMPTWRYSLGAACWVVLVGLGLAVWYMIGAWGINYIDDYGVWAGALTIPLVVWLAFAFYLSVAYWYLNPDFSAERACAKTRSSLIDN